MTLRELIPFTKKSVPVKRDYENSFAFMRHDMDTLFDDFFRGFEVDPFFRSHTTAFSPKVDVTENDKEIRVSAELPGINEKDIDITLNHDSLTIKGEKKEEKEDKGKDYYRMERSYGSFCRSIPIPVEIETDKVNASYKKGILKIRIPKSPKSVEEKKKIKVKTE
jgi:HSP20 family protein